MFGSGELYHICRLLSSCWYQSNQSASAADALISSPLTATCEITPLCDTLCTFSLSDRDTSALLLPFNALFVPWTWLRSGLHFDCVICGFISLLKKRHPEGPATLMPLIALAARRVCFFFLRSLQRAVRWALIPRDAAQSTSGASYRVGPFPSYGDTTDWSSTHTFHCSWILFLDVGRSGVSSRLNAHAVAYFEGIFLFECNAAFLM